MVMYGMEVRGGRELGIVELCVCYNKLKYSTVLDFRNFLGHYLHNVKFGEEMNS